MKKNKLAFALSLVAGLLCFSNFIYKFLKFDKTDYMILLAGVFITAMGISMYARGKPSQP
jgi:small neutral amino acid transporter SnatA (MarC family)